MINLVISLGGMEVDKMEKHDEGKTCPIATQDPEVNEINKMKAEDQANYRGPNEGSAFRLTEICGNCEYYNQTLGHAWTVLTQKKILMSGTARSGSLFVGPKIPVTHGKRAALFKDDDIVYNKQDIL
jgi:hypothetical protein